MPTAFKAIATVTTTSTVASISFTGIPSTYTDLYVYISGRSNRTNAAVDAVDLGFNGSYANFYGLRGGWTGSAIFGGAFSGSYIGISSTDAAATSAIFGNTWIYIPDYAGSTVKTAFSDARSDNQATTSDSHFAAAYWSQTSAITEVNFRPQSGASWVAKTKATLYGITKA